jgi:phytoene synthase
MSGPIEREARVSIKRNGKTFWFASLFLPKRMASDAAILYSFCRNLDDVADRATASGSTRDPVHRLQQIRKDLSAAKSQDPLLAEILQLASRTGLDLRAAVCLLDTLLADASGCAEILDEGSLIRYCYGAAGTVGLMMCGILGVDSPRARLQAINLGIAMQLTNIARDVVEDATLGRRYLPGIWVSSLTAGQISDRCKDDAKTRAVLAVGIERVLTLADIFYAAAVPGFDAIPARARKGIRIAAAVYREIGVILRQRGCDCDRDRVVVPMLSKLRIAMSVYTGQSRLEELRVPEDLAQFHAALDGLPGLA